MDRNMSGLWTLLVLFLPAVVMVFFYRYMTGVFDIKVPFALLHIATLAWVVFFFVRLPCRVSVLPVSFLLAAAVPVLIDRMKPGMFQYLGSTFMAVLYALPWTVVALIASVAALVAGRRK